jgi:membrane protein YqaA with SNARE-associated domain
MEWKTRWEQLRQTNWFRRLYASIGTVMIVLSFLIIVDPEPFVRLGYPGIFVFNLFGPGTLLIPSLSLKMNVWGLALSSAGGMAINDSVSWMVGHGGRAIITPGKRTERVERAIGKYGGWAFLGYSILPFPFDFVGLIAGYLRFSYWKMLGAAFVGKVTRFVLMGMGTGWLMGVI